MRRSKNLPGGKLGDSIAKARKRSSPGQRGRGTKSEASRMGFGAAKKRSGSHGAGLADVQFNFAKGTSANHSESPAARYERGALPGLSSSSRKSKSSAGWRPKTAYQNKVHRGESRIQRPTQTPRLKASGGAHNVASSSPRPSRPVTTTPTQPRAWLNEAPQRVPRVSKPIGKTSKRKERPRRSHSPSRSPLNSRRKRSKSQQPGATAALAVVVR